MTEARADRPPAAPAAGPSPAEAEKRLRRRYASERRFRSYGIAAIAVAVIALATLVWTIVSQATSAFTRHKLNTDFAIEADAVDKSGARDPERLMRNMGGFQRVIRTRLGEEFPEALEDRALRGQLNALVTRLAARPLAEKVADDPSLVGGSATAWINISDDVDLYLKGLVTDERVSRGDAAATPTGVDGSVVVAAPGAFASLLADVKDQLRVDATRRFGVAEDAQIGLDRTRARQDLARSAFEDLQSAGDGDLAARAEVRLAGGDRQLDALARLAGAASVTNDADALRGALDDWYASDADARSRDVRDLLQRADTFARRAERAAEEGAPEAETRRVQASVAYRAADRLLAEAAAAQLARNALGEMALDALLVETSRIVDRPLGGHGALAAATDDTLRGAVALQNAVEASVADAAIADVEAQIRALEARIVELQRDGETERAEALAEAVESVGLRLKRRQREAGVFADTLQRIPEMDSAALLTEANAQLGLEFGGRPALAFALGAAEAGAAVEYSEVRALMQRADERALERLDRDVVRLERKVTEETQAAEALMARAADAGAQEQLTPLQSSYLVELNGGVILAHSISADRVSGDTLIPLEAETPAAAGAWRTRILRTPAIDRNVSDAQIAWANALEDRGLVKRVFNSDLFTNADSTYPELAGVAAAMAGTFWTMLVTMLLAVPVGVMAAIYLEEFAPRNWVTNLVEVNINNLAAVPSIVFGLLGAAVFLNFFNMPRSAPIVGGIVLSLMTLPTVIIASRAALKAVPPSIRTGALGVGASKTQTVFQHVLPLAAPGILTGAIIGMAQALGETAPLLLIGMVAFVAEPPADMFDSATVLPVLIFKWSTGAERAWQPMTSAAIVILLVFMVLMNALAVYLRRRFERRW